MRLRSGRRCRIAELCAPVSLSPAHIRQLMRCHVLLRGPILASACFAHIPRRLLAWLSRLCLAFAFARCTRARSPPLSVSVCVCLCEALFSCDCLFFFFLGCTPLLSVSLPVPLCPRLSLLGLAVYLSVSHFYLPPTSSVMLRWHLAPFLEPIQSTPSGEWWWFKQRCCLPPPQNLSNSTNLSDWMHAGVSSMSNMTNTSQRCCPIPDGNSSASNLSITALAARDLRGNAPSNSSSLLQNCSWGIGVVCPEPPIPAPPDPPPGRIPDEDGGLYVAGVVAGGVSGIGDIQLNCTGRPGQGDGEKQWSQVVALRRQEDGSVVQKGGFILRLNSTGRTWWAQGPVPAVHGPKRVLAGIRLAPWLSTSPDTYAAHGMPARVGARAAGAVGVYVICRLKTVSTEPQPSDVVSVWVARQNATATLNLTRVPGDALLVALLAGIEGDVSWLRLVSGPSLALDVGAPAAGASGSSPAESLAYIPASWKGGALTMQR